LAAADTARSAGRRSESVALLRRLLSQAPDDARAPLAAFTLGRILFDGTGAAGRGGAGLRRGARSGPGGSVCEDALAREAEAWNKAGDPGKAAERARSTCGSIRTAVAPDPARADRDQVIGRESMTRTFFSPLPPGEGPG